MDYVRLLMLLIKSADVDAIANLEKKVIEEFHTLLCKVRKGYKPDYEFILEEISFIELIATKSIDEKLSLTALQYYLNNKWQMNLY